MKRSIDHLVTSHTGSLPRPGDLLELLRLREKGELVDEEGFHKRVLQAVKDAVQQQVACGISLVNDGEQGKPGYATYIKDRVSGFGGVRTESAAPHQEARDYPEYTARRAANMSSIITRAICDGPIEWRDFAAVGRDIENLKAALRSAGIADAFMTAASPGVVSFFMSNTYYASSDEYLQVLADTLRLEYEAITNAGFELQIDCPDLASRQPHMVDLPITEFRMLVGRHVELVNEATKNIAPENMRIHLCWGNYEGPHYLDVPLSEILDIVLTCKPQVISFEGANPRHEHEWSVWGETKLPDDKVIMPGVIDSTTNFIEHPELVAQRLMRYASVVGRERIIAGSDCGFGTNAASNTVDPRIAWAKLKALCDGAALASKELWN